MRRFRRFDQSASYVGLVPLMNDSGEKQNRAGLSHRRNRHLRSILIEAAWVTVRRNPTLTASFAQLTQRMKKQEAIVRIAKKLLRRIRHVWKNRCPYDPPPLKAA